MVMNNKLFRFQPAINPGYTLVEAAVALGLSTILLGLVIAFMIAMNRMSFFLTDQSEAVATADKTVSLLSKQLRETSDGDNGSFAIDEAADHTLAFFSDIDADNSTEYIKYYLTGTDLMRTTIEPTGVPAEYDVDDAQTVIVAAHIVNETYSGNPIFTYYDTENNLLAAPIELGAVTLVGIRIDVNINPNNIPDTHAIETKVQLRNLNDNL